MAIRLGENNYGKQRVRILQVTRHPDRHDIKELAFGIRLEGDIESAHSKGDNRNVLPTDTMSKRRQLARQIENDDAAIKTGEEQCRVITEKEAAVKDIPFRFNQLISQYNDLRAQIRQIGEYRAACQKELDALDDPRDKYVQAVVDLSDSMEAAVGQYQVLAADEQVKSALTQVSTGMRVPARLGPSAQFAQELPGVRRERLKITSSRIKFRIEGGVPQVDVTLDGTLNLPMVIDSGAAIVTLPWIAAQKLGMTPGPDDPTMQLVTADGKSHEAKVMTLSSVRLDAFSARNIKCAIMPESMKDAPCLLGGTFLQNFVYRMDLTAGFLVMSQINPGGVTSGAGTVSASPAIRPAAGPEASPVVAKGGPDALHELARGAIDVRLTATGVEITRDGQIRTPTTLSVPVRIDVSAMTDSTNIRLYFGTKGAVIFNWEQNQNELRYQDPASGDVIAFGGKGQVPANTWVHLTWTIEPTRAVLAVDGKTRAVIAGDYAGLSGKAGVGAHMSKVRVRQFDTTQP